ncbi:MAG: sulfoxide reductase heme-binding subunit YedZ [Burkholderiales bacterium]|nr:sulfoxide reductase heme-binding subunit YedZ [Burkholderiales bacterium]
MVRALLGKPQTKSVIFTIAALPFCYLVWGAFNDALGANPAEYLIRSTGELALRFLCLTLAITPLRVIAGLPELLRFRRLLGLFVYFYACIHLLCYSWLDMGFEWIDIAADIAKRPFILVGFTAFVLLTPLAATSFNRAIRSLGARRWQMLHRVVYGIALLAVLHFYWMRAGKSNFAEVVVYGGILAALLLWRVWNKRFARH